MKNSSLKSALFRRTGTSAARTGWMNSPWTWVPTLYFAEGLPYFVVNNISVIMFSRMGVPNETMALFTGLLYLPWTIKPLWSPFVDILKTKRWWVLTMQALMTAAFVLLALTLPRPCSEDLSSKSTPISLFNFTLILFAVTSFASATHDIAADGFYMLALNPNRQSLFVGIRSTFYRISSVFGQGVLVFMAGMLEKSTGNVSSAWRLTLAFTAVIMAAISLYHVFFIPKPAEDVAHVIESKSSYAKEFFGTFYSFFSKKGIVPSLLFLLLFRFPEALTLKLVAPFLMDPVSSGGLGLSTEAVGIAYGTVGIVALTLGGIVGGVVLASQGLKKSLVPMALALTLPCFVYLWLAAGQNSNLILISACLAFEQFGYGFGFTAYMLYMIYFSRGESETSHYALCTGFMALSMMLPGMLAGYIWKWLGGYLPFFCFVMASAALSIVSCFMVRVEPLFGKK